MDDDLEQLFMEIAKKHGVTISRDDPIMILQTLNKWLLEDSAKAQKKLINQFQCEMEDSALRWGDNAKNMAERVLNASLAASQNAMSKNMEENAKITSSSVKTAIDASLTPIIVHIRKAKKIAIFNVIAASISLLAALIVLWATLR